MRKSLLNWKMLAIWVFSFLVLSIPLNAMPWTPDANQETSQNQQTLSLSSLTINFSFENQWNFQFQNTSLISPQADCLFTTSYGSNNAPTEGCQTVQFTTCNFAGEYATMNNAVAGNQYTFMSSVATDYLTIREGTFDGPVIAQGVAPVSAIPTISGSVFIHIAADADCSTQTGCRATTAVCTSCAQPADYCPVTSENTIYGIALFSTSGGIDNIDNPSGPGQYTDYTSMFVSQIPGESIEFTINSVDPLETFGYGIWVDWGNNFCFYDAGDMVYNSNGYIESATGFIQVPPGTPVGDYRIRVVNNWLASSPIPCGNLGSGSYGEAEDYTFRVVSPGGELDYCIPEGTDSTRFINNFITSGGSENISNMGSGFSTGGYGDFHETMGVTQIQGQSIDFTADMQGGTFGFRAWVDWNQDGIFDPVTEVAYQSNSYLASVGGSITVPTGAALGNTRMRVVCHWLSTTGNIDPCATGFTYGEFEDYRFTVVAMPDCTGTPSGGTVSVTPSTGNAGSSYTVSSTGYTIGSGITYQWQSNTDGAGWVNEGVASSEYADFVATAPTAIGTMIEWRLAVVCTYSGEIAYSNSEFFTTGLVYCEPTISFIEPITRVIFADIDNSSDPASTLGYEDFTSIIGNVSPGDTQSIALEGYTGGPYTNYFTVWVDWNINGTFETGEMYQIGSITNSTGTDGQQATGSITIPDDATVGTTRMRVIKNYASSPTNPCGPYSFGQVEDYSLIVASLPDCSGTPEAGTITGPDNICANVNFTLKAEGATSGVAGLIRQWQSSPAGQNNWSDIAGATSTTYVVTGGISEAMDYRFSITCSLSGESDITDVHNITLNAAEDCYCIPEGTNSTRFINNFTAIGNGDSDISNLNSGFSAGGYGDFTAMTVSADADGTISFNADISGGTAGFRAWVDWNRDGSFDPVTEVAYQSTNYQNTQAGVFTVPTGLDGNYRMRVVSHWLSTTGDVSPCAVGFTYGEFEDYTISVGESNPGTDCSQGIPSFAEIPNAYSITIGNSFRTADDFSVENGITFSMNQITIDTNQQLNPNNAIIFIREDIGGTPGAVVATINAAPSNNEVVGSAFGDPIIHSTFDLATPVDLISGTYWLDAKMSVSDGSTVWLAVTDEASMGAAAQRSTDDGATWTEDPDLMNVIFTVSGICSASQSCSGTPEAGTITGPDSICPNTAFALVAEGASSGLSGLVGQWQSSPAGQNNWTDITGATSTSYNAAAGITESMDYRFSMTCTASGQTDQTAVHTVNLNAPNECYCIPTTSFVEPITRVAIANIDNSSDPNATQSYEDFTSIVGNVNQQGNYEIALEGNTAGNYQNFFTVWADWNQNGTFESTEMFEIGSITNSTGTDGQQAIGTIAVPTDAMLGQTRMRVIKNYSSSPTDPCGPYTFGQIEDYTLNVESLGTSDIDAANFAYWPNPVKNILNISSEKGIQSIDIFNLAGQNIMTNAKATDGQIDLSRLSNGSYIVRVTLDSRQVKTFKILKK